MKKFISVILSIILCFSAFCTVAFAAEEAEPFTYIVDAEGYAVLVDCDESVEGEIIIPSVVEIDESFYEVKYIGDSAFADCALITSITLSDGIEQIGYSAFMNCTGLEHLYVPESLLVCMYDAFVGCGGVVLHCYSSNYQLLTVFGLVHNLKIDIIDSTGDDLSVDLGPVGDVGGIDMTNTIILLIKRIVQMILYFMLDYDVTTQSPVIGGDLSGDISAII